MFSSLVMKAYQTISIPIMIYSFEHIFELNFIDIFTSIGSTRKLRCMKNA